MTSKRSAWMTALGVVLVVIGGACLWAAWSLFLSVGDATLEETGVRLAAAVGAGIVALGSGITGVIILATR